MYLVQVVESSSTCYSYFASYGNLLNQTIKGSTRPIENRFMIIGRPMMPRRQNLRSIVAVMPRLWGQAGIVHSHITEGRRFQFVFPTEEEMELVLQQPNQIGKSN